MLLLASIALAVEPPPPIVNGSTTSDFPQVVTLFAVDRNGYGGNFCSGTLIAPTWVLTAAHCVEAMSSDFRGYDLYVVAGSDLDSNRGITEYVQAASWAEHPRYDAVNLQNDIGIVELTSRMAMDFMPVNKDAISSRDMGDDYRYVGWGITSDNAQDSTKKRTADLPAYDYDGQVLYASDPTDQQNVCSGDSGGAGLEMLSGGGYELAAVNSFVFSPDGDRTPCVGGATGGTRVDAYISWIEGYTPVYNAAELAASGGGGGGGTDTGGGGGTDTGGGGGTDTGTTDTGGADTGSTDVPTGSAGDTDLGDPALPDEVGEDYAGTKGLGCATAPVHVGPLVGPLTPARSPGTLPSGAGWLAAGLALLVRRRR